MVNRVGVVNFQSTSHSKNQLINRHLRRIRSSKTQPLPPQKCAKSQKQNNCQNKRKIPETRKTGSTKSANKSKNESVNFTGEGEDKNLKYEMQTQGKTHAN